MRTIDLAGSQLDVKLPIDGLGFQRNTYIAGKPGDNLCVSKLASSAGPLVSDFVTHQNDFSYDSYGIHIGQDDRLTFLCSNNRKIIGYFIDCRNGSDFYGLKLKISFSASAARRLIIPRGVAHSFDNLASVVTRDEPVWYSDFYNPDWDINNDLISD